MFEKGYGLETRTGGWRFNRVREDKKDVDEESTVLALVKGLETLVTKEQVCHLDACSARLMEICCNSKQNRPLTAPCYFGGFFFFCFLAGSEYRSYSETMESKRSGSAFQWIERAFISSKSTPSNASSFDLQQHLKVNKQSSSVCLLVNISGRS